MGDSAPTLTQDEGLYGHSTPQTGTQDVERAAHTGAVNRQRQSHRNTEQAVAGQQLVRCT